MASNAPNSGSEFIFGKAPEQTITPSSTFTPEQSAQFRALMAQLGGGFDMPNLSLAGLDEFTRLRATGGLTTADNEFLRTSVDEPLIRTFREEALPALSRNYAGGGGFYGSERVRSEERLTENLLKTIGSEHAKFASGKESERSQQLLQALLGKGGLQIQGQQNRLQQQSLPLQLMMQALGIQQTENIAFNDPGTEGLLQSLLQAGGMFAGGAGAAAGAAAFL